MLIPRADDTAQLYAARIHFTGICCSARWGMRAWGPRRR